MNIYKLGIVGEGIGAL